MPRWHISPQTLEAAGRWRDRCLVDDGSILSDKRLWTGETLAHLDRHFLQNLETGEGTFLSKLEAQLDGAPPAAKQLAAEMLWILYLSMHESSMRGTTKRIQIKQVWEWSGEALPDNPRELGELLEHGVANPGPGFQTNRWREFALCIELGQNWKRLPQVERRRLVDDPWGFAAWLDSVPGATVRQFRHMLLYLLFPDHFERVMTSGHKEEITRTLLNRFGMVARRVNFKDRVAVDRTLHDLRPRLEAEFPNARVDFYEPPVQELWRKPATSGGASGGGRTADEAQADTDVAAWADKRFGGARVWVIAPGEVARLWDEFQRESMAAIGWDFLGDLSEYASYEEVYAEIQAEVGGNPTNSARACWQFSRDMRPGDFVVAKRGRRGLLGYGRIRGEYRFDEDRAEYQHVRGVTWERKGDWELPHEHSMVVKTLTEYTPYPEWLHAAFGLMDGAERPGPDPQPDDPGEPIPFTVDDALEKLFLTREQFTGVLDTLARKKNLILEGAPGVGKTFVARRIAWALLKEKENARVEMVQFHQSYAYEDFVQGWRPTEQGGFELRNGTFHRFCRRAAARPQHDYVFIIDEINRGNLSKIFGELMMLIEHDKRGEDYAVQLTYSKADDERFFVPPNVYLLGMMNTADRSLALVDYALRRRFAFVRLRPAFTSDAFAEYMTKVGVSEEVLDRIVSRMTELNREIARDAANLGPGFEIGHSFFVPGEDEEEADAAWFERVIRQEIEPLLQEYWLGDPARVERRVAELLA